MVWLEERAVTPRYIREVMQRYGLSFEELDRKLGYAPNSNQSQHAVSYPNGRHDARTGKTVMYLNARYKQKFVALVGRLKQAYGDVWQVQLTNGAKPPPRVVGFAGNPRKCAGCKKPFYELPPDGYCGDACRARRKKKR